MPCPLISSIFFPLHLPHRFCSSYHSSLLVYLPELSTRFHLPLISLPSSPPATLLHLPQLFCCSYHSSLLSSSTSHTSAHLQLNSVPSPPLNFPTPLVFCLLFSSTYQYFPFHSLATLPLPLSVSLHLHLSFFFLFLAQPFSFFFLPLSIHFHSSTASSYISPCIQSSVIHLLSSLPYLSTLTAFFFSLLIHSHSSTGSYISPFIYLSFIYLLSSLPHLSPHSFFFSFHHSLSVSIHLSPISTSQHLSIHLLFICLLSSLPHLSLTTFSPLTHYPFPLFHRLLRLSAYPFIFHQLHFPFAYYHLFHIHILTT